MVLIIFILVCSAILEGCWDYREVNDLGIISGMAIDKSNDGKGYLLTVELVDLRGAGRENKIQSKRVQSEGKSVLDSIRNIIKLSGKRLYWSHADIVILSEAVAREGILPIVDVYHRVRETRLPSHILISKKKTARELFSQQSITTEIRSEEMRKMIIADKAYLGKSPHVDIRDFINMLSGEGQAPILAAVGTASSEGLVTSELSGTAIFKSDKLVGYLGEEDTKYLLFVKNQIHDAILPLNENSESVYNGTTLEVIENKTKVKPVISNGKISMNIDINTVVSLDELSVNENLIDEKGREKLKNEAEKILKSNVENVITKVKEEYGLDIFGFGNTIKRDMPAQWKTLSSNWSREFKDLDVNVNVKIKIRESGISLKPIKVGEQ